MNVIPVVRLKRSSRTLLCSRGHHAKLLQLLLGTAVDQSRPSQSLQPLSESDFRFFGKQGEIGVRIHPHSRYAPRYPSQLGPLLYRSCSEMFCPFLMFLNFLPNVLPSVRQVFCKFLPIVVPTVRRLKAQSLQLQLAAPKALTTPDPRRSGGDDGCSTVAALK